MRKIQQKKKARSSTQIPIHLSDSESKTYINFVREITTDRKKFSKFRRNFHYREILEHVSYSLGLEYYDLIDRKWRTWMKSSRATTALNQLGNPRRYFYADIGFCSPTTLRYIHTAQQIEKYFGKNIGEKVVEIGVGFGGQMTILREYFDIKKYVIFDLDEVLQLTKKYLFDSKQLSSEIEFKNNLEMVDLQSDIVISNFAFSELPRKLQLDYLCSILSQSRKGFLQMNSGIRNVTGRSNGKLTISEIQSYLPHSRILEEIPLSGPDNYLLIWGAN